MKKPSGLNWAFKFSKSGAPKRMIIELRFLIFVFDAYFSPIFIVGR